MTELKLRPIYCPVCGRWIEPEPDCAVYVHDDIAHTDDDIEALNYDMQ